MSNVDWRYDLESLASGRLDKTRAEEVRASLAQSDDPSLFAELVRLATDPATPGTFARESGGLIGRMLWRQGRLEEAPLADFTTAGYQGFNDAADVVVPPEKRGG